MSEKTTTCPYCGLPPVLPESCTQELHEAIEKLIAKDWEMFTAGWDLARKTASDAQRKS